MIEPVREKLDHLPGRLLKLEIVGLDQHERFSLSPRRIGNNIVENPAIAVGKLGPQFRALRPTRHRARQARPAEIGHLACFLCDVIAVGVANRTPLVARARWPTTGGSSRSRLVRKTEKHSRSLAVAFAGKILPDIVANQLWVARCRGSLAETIPPVAGDEFLARGNIRPRPGRARCGNESKRCHRTICASRVDDVGKFFGLHKNPERLNGLSRGWQAIEVARTGGR